MSEPVYFYMLVRTDLKSMTPGRVAAQTSHAANHMSSVASSSGNQNYVDWAHETLQNYGTAIVLDGGSLQEIEQLLEEIEATTHDDTLAGFTLDPSYSVRDGTFTHYVETKTVGWVLTQKNSKAAKLLSKLRLYNG